MMTRRAAAILCAWLAVAVTVLAADDIRVTPLVVDETRIFASFQAASAFSADEETVMRSGLPLTFTYTIEVRKPASVWFDSTIGRTTVSASVKHDNLTGSFQVSKAQDGQVVWSESTTDETEARGWMTVFEKIPVAVTRPLEPNAEYYLRVRLHTNPRSRFSIWPWGRDDGSGRADFAYIR